MLKLLRLVIMLSALIAVAAVGITAMARNAPPTYRCVYSETGWLFDVASGRAVRDRRPRVDTGIETRHRTSDGRAAAVLRRTPDGGNALYLEREGATPILVETNLEMGETWWGDDDSWFAFEWGVRPKGQEKSGLYDRVTVINRDGTGKRSITFPDLSQPYIWGPGDRQNRELIRHSQYSFVLPTEQVQRIISLPDLDVAVLPNPSNEVAPPFWSPKRDRVVVSHSAGYASSSNASSQQGSWLTVLWPKTQKQKSIQVSPAIVDYMEFLSWSKDGRYLLVDKLASNPAIDLYVIDTESDPLALVPVGQTGAIYEGYIANQWAVDNSLLYLDIGLNFSVVRFVPQTGAKSVIVDLAIPLGRGTSDEVPPLYTRSENGKYVFELLIDSPPYRQRLSSNGQLGWGWSTDGHWIIGVQIVDDTGQGNKLFTWLNRDNGKVSTRSGYKEIKSLAWIPSIKKFIYQAETVSGQNIELLDPATGKVSYLVSGSASAEIKWYSKDSLWLIWQANNGVKQAELWRVDGVRLGPFRYSGSINIHFKDAIFIGKQLYAAFIHDEIELSPIGGGPSKLVQRSDMQGFMGMNWSPDGRYLVLGYTSGKTGRTVLDVIDREGVLVAHWDDDESQKLGQYWDWKWSTCDPLPERSE